MDGTTQKFLRVLAVLVFCATAGASVSHARYIRDNVDGSQTLLKTSPADIGASDLLYHAYSNEAVKLQVMLPVRNQGELTNLVTNLYDPKSPSYHQWITPTQFTQQYGYTGSEVDLAMVKEYLASRGMFVSGSSPNGLVLYVNGPAVAVEHAFGVHMNHYMRHRDGAMFYAPDADPTIPAQLAGKIAGIGMDNLPKYVRHLLQPQAQQLAGHAVGTGPGGYLAPNDVKAAYNMSSIPSTGAGQTMALFELDGYKSTDISHYDAQFSINYSGTLSNVLIDGFTGTPNFTSTGGADEVTLDIELATAFASGSNIMVYEAANTTQAWIDEWTKIASDNKAKVVSCSWGEAEEDSPTLSFDNGIFQQMATQGQAVFVAAGDNGAFDAGGTTLAVDEPAAQPYVAAVGISKLTLGANETYGSESASTYGGGGITKNWSIPTYQTTMASQAVKAALVSTTMRNIPDVALTADAATPYSFYINGSWGGFYGSSIAAPIWASLLTLVNQGLGANAPLGFANPWIYQLAQSSSYAADFHSITAGNNGYYPAEPGFNDADGLGSFNGLNLYNDLINSAKPVTVPAAPAGVAATAGNAVVSLSWNAATGAVSYMVLRSTKSGGPYSTIASNVKNLYYTDSSVTNATTYYYVVSAVNSAGGTNSSQVSATPTAPPAPPASVLAPTNLTGVSSTYGGKPAVYLSWKQSTSANIKYNGFYYLENGKYVYLGEISATTAIYITGTNAGSFYMTAVNSSGLVSPASNTTMVVPPLAKK